MTDLEMARVFRGAAEYLRVHGKTGVSAFGGEFGHDGGPRCVVGAIGSVSPQLEPHRMDGRISVWEADVAPLMVALGFACLGDIYTWSDCAEPVEVIDHLESTALALEIKALAEEGVAVA